GAADACTGSDLCCEGRCVNVLSDTMACGGCGMHCAPGQVCEDGECVAPPCDPACGAGETCVGSVCQCGTGPACTGGQACCGGTCVDTASSTTNCGTCGNTCTSGQTCLSGTCTTDAPCPAPCGIGETCTAGTCRCGTGGPCPAGQRCCGGECVDINSNVGHCGACGRVCGGSEQCCSGLCTNTQTSVNNCGSCGNVCGDTANGCTAGSCTCRGLPECPDLGGICVCFELPPFGLPDPGRCGVCGG